MAETTVSPKTESLRSSMIAVTSHNVFDGSTTATGKGLASASNITRTVTYTKSGYRPLGIIGWIPGGTYSSFINVYELYLSARSSGSATVRCSVRNITGSGTSTAHSMDLTLTIYILWVKEG